MNTSGVEQPKSRRVEVVSERKVWSGFLKVLVAELRFELYNGAMSTQVPREALERGDSVAVLLHDPVKDEIYLAEQFRYPVYKHGNGWILELPAGTLSEGETHEACVRREALEEAGIEVGDLERVVTVYVSPGGSSERVHIFYSQVRLGQWTGEGGGVVNESEDIRVVAVSTTAAFDAVRSGIIEDAKTVLALQWLELKLALP